MPAADSFTSVVYQLPITYPVAGTRKGLRVSSNSFHLSCRITLLLSEWLSGILVNGQLPRRQALYRFLFVDQSSPTLSLDPRHPGHPCFRLLDSGHYGSFGLGLYFRTLRFTTCRHTILPLFVRTDWDFTYFSLKMQVWSIRTFHELKCISFRRTKTHQLVCSTGDPSAQLAVIVLNFSCCGSHSIQSDAICLIRLPSIAIGLSACIPVFIITNLLFKIYSRSDKIVFRSSSNIFICN